MTKAAGSIQIEEGRGFRLHVGMLERQKGWY